MVGEVSKAGLEEIIMHLIAEDFVNSGLRINVLNFKLLRQWTSKNGMSDDKLFEGMDYGIREVCTEKKDFTSIFTRALEEAQYISNYDSMQIFNNVKQFFGEGPEKLKEIGYEAFGMKTFGDSMKPYIMGRGIEDLLRIVGAVNSKYNKTKQFSSKIKRGDVRNTAILRVEPLTGLITPKTITYWTEGIYKRMVETTKDEIHCNEFIPDYNLGSWTIKVVYTPNEKKNVLERATSRIVRKVGDKAEKLLNRNKELIDQEQANVKAIINGELRSTNLSIKGLESRDEKAANHCRKVSFIALLLAKQLGLKHKDLRDLAVGAMLHDYGKNSIPDEILHKEGRFDEDERRIMKTHTLLGEYHLLDMGYSREIARLATEHQERSDGSGYPFGITWKQTSLLGLILQQIDPYDALLENRVYRDKLGEGDVVSRVEGDINRGVYNEIIGENFLKYTHPLLMDMGYGEDLFNFSHPSFMKPEHSVLMEDLIGYFKGHNTKFDILEGVPANVRRFVETHKVEPFQLERRIGQIGVHLANAYESIERDFFRKMMGRIIPDHYKNERLVKLRKVRGI